MTVLLLRIHYMNVGCIRYSCCMHHAVLAFLKLLYSGGQLSTPMPLRPDLEHAPKIVFITYKPKLGKKSNQNLFSCHALWTYSMVVSLNLHRKEGL